MNFHFKIGLVCDTKAGYARVVFKEDNNATTDWLPLLVKTSMNDKESWFPAINEQVCVICNQNMNEGTILGSIHSEPDVPDTGAAQGKFRKIFEDGTYLEYDKNVHMLTANVQGDVIIQAINATVQAQNINADADENVTIKSPIITLQGNVTIEGNLTAGSLSLSAGNGTDGKVHGDMEVSGDVKANGKSLATHIHGGVQSGGSTTLPPQ
jgi:phage baseplate assembly protein V